MFEIIEGTQPKEKPNMELLWLVAFRNALIQEDTKKVVLAGVKYIIVSRPTKNKTDAEEVQRRFDLIDCILINMTILTPREFMQLFPIEKTYDGERWDCKDFYSVMKYIHTLDIDEPIMDEKKLFDLLWEYMSFDINMFMVEWMSSMERMAHLQGEPGPLDKLIDDMGIETHTFNKDPVSGREYLQSNTTGKVMPVKKTVPRYLKLVH
jgi:hypothetical protein